MPRGSKPGEHRGGRKKGTHNKATYDIQVVAREYSQAAIKELARLALEAESEGARIMAIDKLLDRAYGRAPQAVTLRGDPDNPLEVNHTEGREFLESRVARIAARIGENSTDSRADGEAVH